MITITDQGGGKIVVSSSAEVCVVTFADPFTPHDHGDMRWYLEDFRQFPYGGDKWRADQIRRRLAIGGQQIFDQIFGGAGASVFQGESKSGLQRTEIVIRSNDPRFLSVPWELIHTPNPRIGYLAPHIRGIYRQRVLDFEPEDAIGLGDEPLQILLVISRPDGAASIPLASVAEPIMNSVRPLHGLVSIEVLRPPTFENFCRVLAGDKQYHLVHFDGHGAFVEHTKKSRQYPSEKGYILFETADHESDPVSSDRFASAIPKKRAPIFLLNACRSAREGDSDPFASVAAQLVLAGCPCVLAMSFSVYVDTASRFMTAFYRSLLRGSSLVAATTDGRKAIKDLGHQEAARRGYMIEDWIVPAAYIQRPEIRLRKAKTVLGKRHSSVAEGPADPLARHEDMLKIERAMVDTSRPVVFLSGVVGEGKTTLVRGFVRWWTETGGCERATYVDAKGELDVKTLFRSLAEDGNSAQTLDNLMAAATMQLKNTATLLVWDHTDAVLSNGTARSVLTIFFQSLEGAKGRLMVVSRNDCGEWLPPTCQRVTIGDTPNKVVGDFLVEVVARHGGPTRLRREAGGISKLIHAIGWHAGTLNCAGKALATNSAVGVAERLEYAIPNTGDDLIDPIIESLFETLSPHAQMYLPLLGLFGTVVFPRNLGVFSGAGLKEPFYREVFGHTVSWQDWQAILEGAADVGLVRAKLDRTIFEIPPIIRYHLRGHLSDRFRKKIAILRDCVSSFYAGLAAIYGPKLSVGDSGAGDAVLVEESSFLLALHYAMQSGLWRDADAILRLFHVRYDENREILLAIVRDVYELAALDFPRNNAELHLWCTIRLIEADCAKAPQDVGAVEKAVSDVLKRTERIQGTEFLREVGACLRHLGYLKVEKFDYEGAASCFTRLKRAAEDIVDNGMLATALHGLGIVAQSKYEIERAAQFFEQALSLYEANEDIVGACSEYHHLGMLAKIRGEYEEAKNWFFRALRNRERLNLVRDAASDRFLLGEVAESQGHLLASRRWFREALRNYIDLGMDAKAASAAHRLAMVLEQQDVLEEASEWCRWTLGIVRRSGKDLLEGHAYHELGIIASKKGEFQNARDEFQRALGIYERLNSAEHVAGSHLMLGSMAHAEGNLEVAKKEFLEALERYKALNHPRLLQTPLTGLGEIAFLEDDDKLAIERLGEALQITKTWNLSDESRVLQILARVLKKLGEHRFQVLWTSAGFGSAPFEALRAFL